jgi:hypothetical protein
LSIIPFAKAVATAAQTVKAEEELNPASGGTYESMKIFIPFGFSTCLAVS